VSKFTFVSLSFSDLVSDTKHSDRFNSNSKLQSVTGNSVPPLLNAINGLLHISHVTLVTFYRRPQVCCDMWILC
jgi:hypothetical protein